MADPMITPPVPEDVLAEAEKVIQDPANVAEDLTLVQRFVKADKSSVVAAIVHVAVLLVAALGMHLSGTDVATLGSIASGGLSYFVGLNFRTRSKLSAN